MGPRRSCALQHTPLNGTICRFNFSLLLRLVSLSSHKMGAHTTRPSDMTVTVHFLLVPLSFWFRGHRRFSTDQCPSWYSCSTTSITNRPFWVINSFLQDQIRYRCKKLANPFLLLRYYLIEMRISWVVKWITCFRIFKNQEANTFVWLNKST